MTQTKKKLVFSWVLILSLVISVVSPGSALYAKAQEQNISSLSDTYADKLAGVTNYLKKNIEVSADAYTYGFEWRVMQQARNGEVSDSDKKTYHAYYDSVADLLKNREKFEKEQNRELQLNNYATLTIALTAIGADPTNIGGVNIIKELSDYSKYENQYASVLSTALIALDSKKYDLTDSKMRDKIVALLVDNLDAGTGLSGYEWDGVFYEDIDTTAMIMQALAPYYNSNNAVKDRIDKGLASLSKGQGEDAMYGYYDKVCTTSQVACALIALGINPENDKRFIKNNVSMIDAILSYYDASSGIITVEGSYNPLTTCEQAAYTLTAYDRLVKGETYLYDMSDVKAPVYHYGGKANCVKKAVCDVCGQEYGEKDPKNHTGNTVYKNIKAATFTEKGYSGDKVCADCGEVLEKGAETDKVAAENKSYGIINTGSTDVSVEYTGADSKAQTIVTIQNTVKDTNGADHKVTRVADNAFAGNTNITDVTLGENITEIGANAFKNCTKLTNIITQNEDLTTIGASAFAGAKALTEIDFSESSLKTIDANAFSGCKKLKTIKLNGNKLTKVGKNAFKNVKKNAKITIYAKNKKTYNKVVKLIKKSGAKKVKYAYKKKK